MKVFELDGPVYSILNKIADFLILSILYVICCIPVITIGAATAALSYASIKLVHNEGYVARNFFDSFRTNFRQATCIWIPAVIFFGIMILNILFFLPDSQASSISQIFLILNITLLLICAFIFAMVFPLLSRFQNTILHTLTNACIMTARRLPWALTASLLVYLPAIIIFFFPVFAVYILAFWCILGFGIFSYLAAYIYDKKIFSQFIQITEPF